MVKLAIGIGSGGGVPLSVFITAGTGPSEEARWVEAAAGDDRPPSATSAPRPALSRGVLARPSATRFGAALVVAATSGASALADFASTEVLANGRGIAFEDFAPAVGTRFGF